MSAQNPINGSDGRQRLKPLIFHLPLDGLGPAEQVVIVKIKPDELDDLNRFCGRDIGGFLGPTGFAFTPRYIVIVITRDPFV